MSEINITDKVKSMRPVQRAIYAYTTPNDHTHDGWIKIGDTEVNHGENLNDAVNDRIKQQTHTADILANVEWTGRAKFEDDDAPFRDYDFHRYLTDKKNVIRKPHTEWFNTDSSSSKSAFYEFRENHGVLAKLNDVMEYKLRDEQEQAVAKTIAYYESHPKGEFLWNAKPRFGKTLSVYDFCMRIKATNVLILTNRPAIADSWYNDYEKFVGTKGRYYFVSHVDALKGRKYVIPSREDYQNKIIEEGSALGCIEFVSLQDLKGSMYHGGEYDKLEECSNNPEKAIIWDVLVLDEAHEGVDTTKTEIALDKILHKFTLNLSGTPFKMLANEKFEDDAIFNWTYADEQRKKEELSQSGEENPYAELPKLNMFTYQMSEMMEDKIEAGTIVDDSSTQYYFDLNEFFKTNESGYFEHLDSVRKFLDSLVNRTKYPFSTPELRAQLKHTFWLLNRVDSAKALKKELEKHPLFSKYRVILAAGDGDNESENRKAINEVKDAIKEYEYTITLSVGQLTTGVTIPEWSAVLMLCSMKSASLYMQAAFRAQNPCFFSDKDGTTYRKENAYVFDFDPTRTLTIMETIANDQYKETAGGHGGTDERKQHVRELLNFFPVIGEDDEGAMKELDAEEILSIPRHIHAKEVVKHGFMSNFLFQNIGNVFGAVGVIDEILNKITPVSSKEAEELTLRQVKEELELDDEGRDTITDEKVIGLSNEKFGNAHYNEVLDNFEVQLSALVENHQPSDEFKELDKLDKIFKKNLVNPFVDKTKELYGDDMTASQKKSFESRFQTKAEKKIHRDVADYKVEIKKAVKKRDEALKTCSSAEEEQKIKDEYVKTVTASHKTLVENLNNVQPLCEEAKDEAIKAIEKSKIEKKRDDIEDTIRDHLRGFARTIPSFLMAYGNDETKLSNFEQGIPDEVFESVTSITISEFRFLRDGGDYEKDGEINHFAGHLFDEVVFDDSVKEFLRKKQELANYFDEDTKGDIFDYIPPQKNNQIYTPKNVVKQMVDLLEEENPGCFDDPNHTFSDLYMKSGLFITEIVKRLYQSEKMKELYPDSSERLDHILTTQVYGVAPTEIIYMIAMHFIFGYKGDIGAWTADELQTVYPNFKLKDTAALAKEEKLAEWVEEAFG